MALTMPKLDYDLNAFEPEISEQTMKLHYGKHLKNYIDTANTLIKDTIFADKSALDIMCTSVGPVFNNAAQAFNHAFFFKCLTPKKNAPLMPPDLGSAISHYFGDVDKFTAAFVKSATSVFGSGWTWLVRNQLTGELSIVNTQNASNPVTDGMDILLTVDVWEHAYYLDYQNRRIDYLNAFVEHINWGFVGENFRRNLK